MRSAGLLRAGEKSSSSTSSMSSSRPVDRGLVVVDHPVEDRVQHRAGPALEVLGLVLELLAHGAAASSASPWRTVMMKPVAEEDEDLADLDRPRSRPRSEPSSAR